jgi:protocatechuate 3,4-dioxygenase beta subunit
VRTQLDAPFVTVHPGEPAVFDIEVGNDADVIDGVTAMVDGVDPSAVRLPIPLLSLFPESTGTLAVHLQLPTTFPAGEHVFTVRVISTIDPRRQSAHPVYVSVEPFPAGGLKLRPSLVNGGRRAEITALVANTGNVPLDVTMAASDDAKVLECETTPASVQVLPGETVEVGVSAKGKRPVFGQPAARSITVTATAPDVELVELATFNQKPWIPRGVLTILILAGIVALWAAIFLFVVNLLRDQEVPTKLLATNFLTGGTREVSLSAIGASAEGTVTAGATGDGVERVTVEAFRVTSSGIAATSSTATDEDGVYLLESQLPGTYRLRFTADGFEERWYEAATSVDAAADVVLEPVAEVEGLDVELVGLPGQMSGEILIPESTAGQATVTVTQLVEPGDPAPVPQTVTTAGPFAVAGLVTPATYAVRVESPGFDTQDFDVDLGPGEHSVLNTVRMGASAGSLTGQVTDQAGQPLGGVTVSITSGELQTDVLTPTSGAVGAYVVENLPTPRTYVVTFSRDGFGTRTIALDLGPGEARTGVDASLAGGTGTLRGMVTDATGAPVGGAEITVTRGEFTASTSTLTSGSATAPAGSYSVTDLPTPGTFTVTAAAPGFVEATRLVAFPTSGEVSGVDMVLRDSLATLSGTVRGGGAGLGDVEVVLSDGATDRRTITATAPAGRYSFTGVAPGTYTLTVPAVQTFSGRVVLIRLAAGQVVTRDVTLQPAGS